MGRLTQPLLVPLGGYRTWTIPSIWRQRRGHYATKFDFFPVEGDACPFGEVAVV